MIRQAQEYLAAGIRQQIQALNHLLEEIEAEQLPQEALAWRLRAVELGLRHLRETAPATPRGTFSQLFEKSLHEAA